MTRKLPLPSLPQVVLAAFFLIPIAGVAYVSYWIVHWPKYIEQNQRKYMRDQIASVVRGREDFIIISGNSDGNASADEFVRERGQLEGGRPFWLHFVYYSDIDETLNRIRGLRSLKSLWIERSDFTPAGLQHLAHLPDLEALYLENAIITDAELAALTSCPKLTTLSSRPWEPVEFQISKILALPHLESLTLIDTWPDSWIEPRLADLEQATGLKELHLVQIEREKVATLYDRLPHCQITVDESGK